jgi:hypothetical protein
MVAMFFMNQVKRVVKFHDPILDFEISIEMLIDLNEQ